MDDKDCGADAATRTEAIGAGHEGTAGGTAAEVTAKRFDLLRSALYHDGQLRKNRFVNRCLALATILLGSGAFAAFGQVIPQVTGLDSVTLGQIAGILVVLCSTVGLVFGFGEAAVKHMDLRRRYYALLAEVERGGDLAEIAAEETLIYADEPPVNRMANVRAHNRAGDLVYGPGGFDRASLFKQVPAAK